MSCSFPINAALRIAVAFLKHLDLRERDSIPLRTFSFLNATLVASYPPQSSTSDAVSTFIKACHHMIMTTPVSLLQSIIFAIQTGLAVWIEDKCVSLPDDAYNDLVCDFFFLDLFPLLSLLLQLMPLYECLLQRLQRLSLSVTALNDLSPLLTSAFSHMPPPARGPTAFQRFFCAAHSRFSVPITSYNDDLRVCIDACMRGYGGEWPSGLVPLSSQTQTQLQFQSETRPLIDLLAETEVTKLGRLGRSIEVNDLCLNSRTCIEVDLALVDFV
jgi:hypothetical protein